MKKTLLIFLIGFWTLTTFCQNYYPLIEENHTWNVISVALVGPLPWDTTYSTLTYEFFSDTILDGQSYLKLYKSNEENPANWNLWCFMREENKKVWMKPDLQSPEMLMYDFNALQGDTIMIGYQAPDEPLVVDSIGVTSINGADRIKYYLSSYNYQETWIDGIGSDKGICWSGSANLVGGWFRFLCLSAGNELVYRNPNYTSCYLITETEEIERSVIRIFPNPANNFLRIENKENATIESIVLSDANGQFIRQFDPKKNQIDISDITSGLYILKIIHENGVWTEKVIIEK